MEKTNLMKSAQLIVLTVFLALISTGASAQSKYTEDADTAFDRKGYYEASKSYKAAYSKIKGIDEKGRVLFRIGECHRLMLDNAGAEEWYEKAITARYYEEDVDVYYRYAEVFREQEKFDEAIAEYNNYVEKGGDKSKANGRIAECKEAALAIVEPPTRYIVEQVVLLNSPFFDYSPVFSSKNDDEIIFSSSRQSSVGSGEDPITGESFMDLFMAERDKKEKWSTPVPLNNTINTISNEGSATFDKKKSTMYFTRCVYDKKSNFACDIYYSKRAGNKFGPAEPMNLIDRETNDSSQVGHPCLTADDQFLLFASDMPGGYGGKDIWYVQFDMKSETWSSAKNLGNEVNTNGDEMFPFVREDGTLYFSSNGHGGLGGLDLFKAEAIGEMTFANTAALEYPLNSSSDDFGIIWEDEKDQGFFTSSRPGGKGKDDIYEFRMPPLLFNYKATVYNYDTGAPLPNSKVVVQGTDGKSYELTADGNGGVSLMEGEIVLDNNYSVDVSLQGYIGTGDQFSTMGVGESTTFAREYFLKEVIIDKEYDLPLVLYPFDKSELLVNNVVNSKDSLNYLFDLLTRNPNFVIQLESHTDTRGKDQYNRDLSQRRAETCVAYLASKGLDRERMVPVGMGETSPLIKDREINAMSTEEEQERAHQVNRRTVFKILRYDYVPKE